MNGEYLAQGHRAPGGPPLPAPPAPSPALESPPGPGFAAAGPGAPMPGPAEPTGDPRVDELLTGLADLRGRPVGDHVAAYERLHHGLQEILAATGRDDERTGGPGQGGPGQGAGRPDAGLRQGPVPGPYDRGGHGNGGARPGRFAP